MTRPLMTADEARRQLSLFENQGYGFTEAANAYRTVVALHAILDGTTTAPTPEAIAEHFAAFRAQGKGAWVLVEYDAGAFKGREVLHFGNVEQALSSLPNPNFPNSAKARRWWAADERQIPCEWQKVTK